MSACYMIYVAPRRGHGARGGAHQVEDRRPRRRGGLLYDVIAHYAMSYCSMSYYSIV